MWSDIKDWTGLIFIILGSTLLAVGGVVFVLTIVLGPIAIFIWGLINITKLIVGV